jgi:hypothetical protein
MTAMRGMSGLQWALRGRLMVAAGAALLGGCGNPSTAATPTPTATQRPTPSTETRNAVIVKAYVDATAAFVHAEKAMDPNDPALVATMTGEQLSTVKKNLIIDRTGGLIARGDITTRDPHVVSIAGDTATLRDCVYSALLLYDAKTGKAASGNANGPQDVGVTATLTYVDGTWRESLVNGMFGSCALGY